MKNKEVINHIVSWLKNYAQDNKMNGFVVGVSGGIDSALTSTLCAKTGLPTLCLETGDLIGLGGRLLLFGLTKGPRISSNNARSTLLFMI